jgi:hypothetical protein
MIMHEKFIANWIGGNFAIELAAYAVIIGGGLGFGWLREKARREKRDRARELKARELIQ